MAQRLDDFLAAPAPVRLDDYLQQPATPAVEPESVPMTTAAGVQTSLTPEQARQYGQELQATPQDVSGFQEQSTARKVGGALLQPYTGIAAAVQGDLAAGAGALGLTGAQQTLQHGQENSYLFGKQTQQSLPGAAANLAQAGMMLSKWNPAAIVASGVNALGNRLTQDDMEQRLGGQGDDFAVLKALGEGGLDAAFNLLMQKGITGQAAEAVIARLAPSLGRPIAATVARTAIGGAAFGANQAAQNAVEGNPITQGVGQAAAQGALMENAGGLIHDNLPTKQATPTAPAAESTPVAPPTIDPETGAAIAPVEDTTPAVTQTETAAQPTGAAGSEERTYSPQDMLDYIKVKSRDVDEEGARQLLGDKQYALRDVPVDDLKTRGSTELKQSQIDQYAAKPAETAPPVVVDDSGQIIDGNRRLEAARLRGDATVKAYVPVEATPDVHPDLKAGLDALVQRDPNAQGSKYLGLLEDRAAVATDVQRPKLLAEINAAFPGTTRRPPPGFAKPSEVGSEGAGPAGINSPGFKYGTDAGESPTSIKNDLVDKERAKRNLPPVMEAGRRGFGEVWDKASKEIDSDPGVQDRLINELKDKPRALTDREDALLLQRQADLHNQFAGETQGLEHAQKIGDEAGVAERKTRLAAVSDKLQELYDINKSSGTETGRGLNARKMMAAEDFSLAAMETRTRAVANDGKPLTEEQKADVKQQHEKIAKAQKDVDTAEKEKSNEAAKKDVGERISRNRQKQTPTEEKETKVKTKDIVGKITRAAAKGKTLEQVAGHINKLAEFLVRSGIHDRDKLVDAVHGAIQHAFPDATRYEVQDAISGYGKFKPLNPDPVKATLRDLKGQMQQIGKLEDMADKNAPQKTGMEHRTPTDEERQLIQQVNEEKRKGGYEATDPAKELASALKTKNTRLKNQITDLEQQIATRQKIVKNRTSVAGDAETAELKARRDELQKQYDEVFGEDSKSKTRTDAQRLAAWKKFAVKRTAELQEKLDEGNFRPAPKRAPFAVDDEGQRLAANLDRTKQAYQEGLLKHQQANRSQTQKVADAFVGFRRLNILSSPVTIAKIIANGVYRMGFKPVEEAVGGAISKVLPGIADRAPIEGGSSVSALAKGYREGVMAGIDDAKKVLLTGRSDLDVMQGQAKMPREMLNFMGEIHGAINAPVKRAAFAYAVEKESAWMMKNGIDPHDPVAQIRLMKDALEHANREVFTQNNRVAEGFNAWVSRLGAPNKDGTPNFWGTVGATATKTEVPIVRLPTNIVSEVLTHAFGTISGGVRAAKAYAAGIEHLDPADADVIMRHLKKGSIGAAGLALGYYLGPDVDKYLPKILSHSPALSPIWIGSKIRTVADSFKTKHSAEPQGIPQGIKIAALGIAEDVPVIKGMVETARAFNPNEMDAFFDQQAKSIAVPALFDAYARKTDVDAQGNPVKRKPQGLTEYLESGVPGLRQNVPTAEEAKHNKRRNAE